MKTGNSLQKSGNYQKVSLSDYDVITGDCLQKSGNPPKVSLRFYGRLLIPLLIPLLQSPHTAS